MARWGMLVLVLIAGCVQAEDSIGAHAVNVCALPCAKMKKIGCDGGSAAFEEACLKNCPEIYRNGIFTDEILQCIVDLPEGSDCTYVSHCAPAL